MFVLVAPGEEFVLSGCPGAPEEPLEEVRRRGMSTDGELLGYNADLGKFTTEFKRSGRD